MKKFSVEHAGVKFICNVEVNGDVSKIQIVRGTNAGGGPRDSKVMEIRNITDTDESFVDMLVAFTNYLKLDSDKGDSNSTRKKYYLDFIGSLNYDTYALAFSKFFEASYGQSTYINTRRLYVDGNGVPFKVTLNKMNISNNFDENLNSVTTYYSDDCPFRGEVELLIRDLYTSDRDEYSKLISAMSLEEREKYFDVSYVPRK
ncbi:MAG: hypothetical protein MJ245_06935 [Clostridia bacterium]|nr:hypothetical protein [Clostridia bacterium]